jgi:hypothetical protein
MSNPPWIDELNRLLTRFSGYGLTLDTYSMTKSELWSVYCLLRRLAGGDVIRRAEPILGLTK